MEFRGPFEAFFKAPQEIPATDGDCVLFWLRRGLTALYGQETEDGFDPQHGTLLATAGILMGFDFLGRAYYGGQAEGNKFVGVLQHAGGVTGHTAEVLYQLRCGLIHSLSLSAVSRRRFHRGQEFRFTLTDNASDPVVSPDASPNHRYAFLVSFPALRRLFLGTVRGLEAACHNPPQSARTTSGGDVAGNVAALAAEKIRSL